MGNGLVVVQMREIPPTENRGNLIRGYEGIYFWSAISSNRFKIPLRFLSSTLKKNLFSSGEKT